MRIELIKVRIIELCLEIFPGFGVDKDLIECVDFVDDFGMDSIMYITFLVEIETIFDIVIPDNLMLIDNFRNVNSIVGIIEEQMAKK